MPCSDGGVPYPPAPPTPAEIEAKKFAKRGPSLLCSAARALERLGYDFDENPELSEWWDKHKKEDAAREQKEREKAERDLYRQGVLTAALKKPVKDLTAEELKILKDYKYL